MILSFRNFFKRKYCGLSIQEFGCRREIIKTAKRNVFEIKVQANYSFLAELERSRVLRKFLKFNFIKDVFVVIGKCVSYTMDVPFGENEGPDEALVYLIAFLGVYPVN